MTREEAITWLENRAKQIPLPGALEVYRMAIAALRELDAQEKQESFGEWISVKDKMPENDTRVLAYCKDRCIHDVKWRWADNAWHDKGSAAVYLAGFVTHWLPMPEPPKEEKR